jgi:hypothetical protein
MGSALLRLLFSVFGPGVTLNTALSNNNEGGVVGTYYVTIDGARTTEFDINPAVGLDYLVNNGQGQFTGSALQSRHQYNYSWFHQEDWTGVPACQGTRSNHVISGLSLDGAERTISVFATVGAASVLMEYAIVQRTLAIQNGQILLV